ncbi:serine/threonine-protein kinase [Roseateles saccharophilus]|uniref:Serine/threonine-protein kinase n=1 Tax=Roseateles saccharophilus TaxID=304 RepID=A0A4R3ULZ0_ROSSA|nr:serine/threonine-protein kinase [Roseateles saccharophilus]MDG0834046.1 serine/threonine protein kinase [Roseateles saccharophilus]TCU90984.1 serine/threonine-protein kinase [Roseateles saccharophilus]
MASSGKSGGFWQRLVGRVAGTADVPPDEASTQPAEHESEAPPTRADAAASGLQDYDLGAEIGRGAMAVVYKATQRSTGRQVAVKRLALSREFSAEDLADVRSRFMREARAAGALGHPDILQVVDAGQDGNDAWIALEYVLGRDLSLFTRPGQLLPVREVVQIGVRLARALAYAHSQGVIHRDIKPANVMLDRVNGSLKLMDFGIARVGDGSRTRTGLVLGTPSFMSPEQLAGLTVDGRSDLYSLGVLLYQLLSGTLPHRSESMARLMQQIATEPAPDVRTRRPGLPESLALVLALALEKRPELRYGSGEQMARDLKAVLAMDLQSEPGAPDAAAHQEATFAQTLRLTPGEAGQNPRSSAEPPEPSKAP